MQNHLPKPSRLCIFDRKACTMEVYQHYFSDFNFSTFCKSAVLYCCLSFATRSVTGSFFSILVTPCPADQISFHALACSAFNCEKSSCFFSEASVSTWSIVCLMKLAFTPEILSV